MYTLKNYKIKIKDKAHSKLIQDELYRLGYDWYCNLHNLDYMNTEASVLKAKENGLIKYVDSDTHFDIDEFKEVDLIDLKETKSIAEEIIEQLIGTEIVIMGETKSLNIYFKGKLEIELKDYLIDLHIDCYQELGQENGEEEVGIPTGGFIDYDNEIQINNHMIIVYDKETCEPYTWINDKLTEQTTEALINRIKFEN